MYLHFILFIVSLISTIAYTAIVLGEGFTPPVIVAAVIQSVIIAAVAVYFNELIEQVTLKKALDETENGGDK